MLASTCWTATGATRSPVPDEENRYLHAHPWDEYAEWHLGLTDGATDATKAGSASSGTG